MAQTYDAIASYTFGSAASSYTFSSLPASWTDLILVVTGTTTSGANNCRYYFNGDNTSGLYSRTSLYGTGSAAGSSRGTSSNYAYAADATTTQSPNIIQIMNYANSNVYKTSLVRGGAADNIVITRVNLWRNTNAITSITVDTDGSTWASGTTMTLYGIKAA